MEPRPTIHDVADRANVSISTVSKVANGRYDGAAETAVRVREAIAELGYRAPPGRQRPRRVASVGLVTDDADPYSVEIVRGATTVVREADGELLVYIAPSGYLAGWERTGIIQLAAARAAAVILCLGNALPRVDLPLVAVAHRLADPPVPTVDADDEGGMALAAQHLLDLGHRRIAHLRGRSGHRAADGRSAGFHATMAAAGLGPDAALERDGEWRAEDARVAVRELLQAADPPTAIAAGNDDSALAAMQEAADLGLRIPEDLSVVGFDDMPASATHRPPLTTVAQPMRAIGETAARVLLDGLAGRPQAWRSVLPCELVVRGTTAPPRQ